ncbi:MAG: Coenzyme F420 hydrogenase/dehydrogenase, beta subunit C-terminal domain, partial [Candidatus Gastranaerophilales bacterium]|nr:Coenzyme F420 hydrogenase/dehydrogenase, beta subunit C-terminal domain [Candidatus Gastranaerophilales bacterium]
MAYDWKQREVKENIDYEIFRPRIQFMSKFLVSDDRSVADFGCGTMILKDFLDENVKYYPIDYVDRGEGTILCDFNKKEFPHSIKSLDCAFMSGFLQYIDSPQWLISKLSSICKKVIITYPTIDYFNDIEDRKSRAWRNHLTQEELISHFTKNNFMVSEIEHRDDFKQLLIVFKNGKNYPVDDNLLCCGCSACKMKCPVGAISIEQDRNGRFRAFIDKEKCTQCGICANICPIINPQFKNTNNPKCFAFDTTEELSHDSATAGGFQILAKHFINNGAKVVGAAWAADEHGNYTNVKHIMVDNLEDLKSLYKSKYLQSDMTNIYEQTKQELEKGTTILFSGVSCQIAGLYSMLGNDYENLYTIDLICHHAPSQGYFKKYLNEQFGENNVKEFDFRAKDKENPYSLTCRVKLKSGEEILRSHLEDSFCRLFHERVIMAKSCENCQFAKYPKQGDITLGDFHRIEETDAASFGRDTLSCDDYNRAQMGYFLSKFDKFTVREANAVDLCRKEFGIDAEVVLDPVFLCPLEYYEKLIESGNYKSNNKIATYVLDKTISFQNIIEDLKQ